MNFLYPVCLWANSGHDLPPTFRVGELISASTLCVWSLQVFIVFLVFGFSPPVQRHVVYPDWHLRTVCSVWVCVQLCPMMGWYPVQGVLCLMPGVIWSRLQALCVPVSNKWYRRKVSIIFTLKSLTLYWNFLVNSSLMLFLIVMFSVFINKINRDKRSINFVLYLLYPALESVLATLGVKHDHTPGCDVSSWQDNIHTQGKFSTGDADPSICVVLRRGNPHERREREHV